MDLINLAYIEVMTAGDAKGRVFTFPIPTYNITDDFPWDSDNATQLFDMTAKYGLPYFQNFLNSELKPNMIRSMCCRLQLDLRELLKRGNGLFGSAEQTGSLGVVTINCARLGHVYKGNLTALYRRLDQLLELACSSLESKRKVIQRHMDAGLFPYTKRYLGTVSHLYMSERISDADACKKLVRRSLKRFRLPYITITPTFSICPVHGYLSGEYEYCPRCDDELMQRKQQEHHNHVEPASA